jgi:hypothetical protein
MACVALVLATLLVIAGCDASAGPTVTLRATHTVAPTPVPPLAGPHMVATLTGISLVAPDEGWIIGRDGYYTGIGAFLLHYHSGAWRLEPLPALVNAKVATPTSIAMVSADSGWIAVKPAPDDTPVILQERAGSWVVDGLPANAGIVTALSAPTSSDAWALSTSTDLTSGKRTSAILHYRAGQWLADATYPDASLQALSMDTASDGWAVGSDSSGPLLLHYTQGAWTRAVPSALGGVATLTSVFMASASVGWASGLMTVPASNCTECGGPEPERVMLRLRDGGWQQVHETGGGSEDLLNTATSSEQLLSESVAAGADGSGWVARKDLVHFAPDGRQQVFSATCQTDFLGMALVPTSSAPSAANGAPEGWVIGSNGQLFHLVGRTLTLYDTGAPCAP